MSRPAGLRAALAASLALASCSEAPGAGDSAAGLSAGQGAGQGAGRAAGPNVVLVVLDTVRADHVGAYGYERPTTPAFDALAAEGTLYTRAFASAPWTLPSHASMFTGLDPTEHRTQTVVAQDGRVGARPLRKGFFTLAEGFSEAGYRTGAFVANASYLSDRYGLDQGFDTYVFNHEPGLLLNRKVFQWLAEGEEGRPFFLFVNYMDAHRPYMLTPRPDVVPEPVERDSGMALLNRLIVEVLPADKKVPRRLVRKVVDQYDLGVASADEALGRLVEALDALDAPAGTLVAVTSDHGEFFGEHHLVEHSKDVYQPVLWVPLVVRPPGGSAARRDDRVVSSAHLPRLLLDALAGPGLEDLRARFPRTPESHAPMSFIVHTRGKDLNHEKWGHRFQRNRSVVFDWPYKYIRSSDGAHELYDLAADPTESDNLLEREPEVAARLARLLEGVEIEEASTPEEELFKVTPEELERLREMGYAE